MWIRIELDISVILRNTIWEIMNNSINHCLVVFRSTNKTWMPDHTISRLSTKKNWKKPIYVRQAINPLFLYLLIYLSMITLNKGHSIVDSKLRSKDWLRIQMYLYSIIIESVWISQFQRLVCYWKLKAVLEQIKEKEEMKLGYSYSLDLF